MKNFESIKKKYFIAAIIASIILGVCLGIGLTCVLAVVFKQCAISLHWVVYIPIAAVIAAGGFWLFFLALRPTDKKLAKKLDGLYGLNQRTQTMVEFAGADGAMAHLQREQANDTLEEVSKKRIDLSWLLKFAVVPVLAIGLLFAGIFVPSKSADQGPVEPPYNITESQETALKNLIENVESSDLEQVLKAPVLQVLNSLLEGLRKEQPQAVMRAAVISSVKIIDNIVASGSSYLKIFEKLNADEQLKDLAQTVANSVIFYKSGTLITTFAGVKSKYSEAEDIIGGYYDTWQSGFMKGFRNEETIVEVSAASGKLGSFAAALNAALQQTPYVPAEGEEATDALYCGLVGLSESLAGIAKTTSGMGAESYYSTIEGAISGYKSGGAQKFVAATSAQAYSCMMDEYIRNALASIFKINRAEFGDSEALVPDGEVEPLPDGNLQGGAHGPGNIVVGSDDLVLNIEYDGTEGSQKQVPYGEVLNDYNDKVSGLVASGNCSDELANYIRQYFQLLYSGIEE